MNAGSSDRLTIALAQLDPTVGDVAGCLDKARQARAAAARAGADVVMFSELFIGGFSPANPPPQAAFQSPCPSPPARPSPPPPHHPPPPRHPAPRAVARERHPTPHP